VDANIQVNDRNISTKYPSALCLLKGPQQVSVPKSSPIRWEEVRNKVQFPAIASHSASAVNAVFDPDEMVADLAIALSVVQKATGSPSA